jgi:hypothetical protein
MDWGILGEADEEFDYRRFGLGISSTPPRIRFPSSGAPDEFSTKAEAFVTLTRG